jgi:hypothetical protein
MVKLTPMNGVNRYRNDPYNCTVLPPIEPSPVRLQPIAMYTLPAAPLPVAAPVVARVVRRVLDDVARAAADESPVPEEAAAIAMPRQNSTSGRVHYAIIKFKHDYATYIAPFKVSAGDAVAVEGDRGENIGTVTEVTTDEPDFPVSMKVVRHASQKDKDHLAMLRRKEAAATKACQEIAESVGLNIRVVDTEYQFDMNKLTIFFASKVPIDFRKFQRELFREFRCRIWIVNWPRKPQPQLRQC